MSPQGLSERFVPVFCCLFVLLPEPEVRFVSGVGEEADEGYLETGTNLVSVVSSLSFLVPLSPRLPYGYDVLPYNAL